MDPQKSKALEELTDILLEDQFADAALLIVIGGRDGGGAAAKWGPGHAPALIRQLRQMATNIERDLRSNRPPTINRSDNLGPLRPFGPL